MPLVDPNTWSQMHSWPKHLVQSGSISPRLCPTLESLLMAIDKDQKVSQRPDSEMNWGNLRVPLSKVDQRHLEG